MGHVKIPATGETIEGAAMPVFLAAYGIDYDHWDLSAIPQAILDRPTLTGEDKQQILAALAAPIRAAQERAGYQSADVVALSPDIPNLDDILKPFEKEHFHTENEIRLVVDGAGVFSINPKTAPVFEVHMPPGDLISVPANTWHWFNLTAERRIKAVRVFESAEGWTACYADNRVIKAEAAAAIAPAGPRS